MHRKSPDLIQSSSSLRHDVSHFCGNTSNHDLKLQNQLNSKQQQHFQRVVSPQNLGSSLRVNLAPLSPKNNNFKTNQDRFQTTSSRLQLRPQQNHFTNKIERTASKNIKEQLSKVIQGQLKSSPQTAEDKDANREKGKLQKNISQIIL